MPEQAEKREPETAPQGQEQRGEREQEQEQERRGEQERRTEGGGNVRMLHTAHAHIPIPYVTPKDMAAGARTITSHLPPPRRLALYGGLGVLAAAGALEWPIAVAIGAATEVLSRDRGVVGERAPQS